LEARINRKDATFLELDQIGGRNARRGGHGEKDKEKIRGGEEKTLGLSERQERKERGRLRNSSEPRGAGRDLDGTSSAIRLRRAGEKPQQRKEKAAHSGGDWGKIVFALFPDSIWNLGLSSSAPNGRDDFWSGILNTQRGEKASLSLNSKTW